MYACMYVFLYACMYYVCMRAQTVDDAVSRCCISSGKEEQRFEVIPAGPQELPVYCKLGRLIVKYHVRK